MSLYHCIDSWYPYLEYYVHIWSLYFQKSIIELKKIQGRTTRMIRGMERLPYKERLNRLGLFSLEKR